MSRTEGADQQRFVYSGLTNDIAAVTDAAGAVQAKYGRDLSGGLLSLQEGGGPALGAMTDLHGDVVGTFSGTTLVDSTAYDPFGEVTHRSGTQRALGYQGEYTGQDTGKVNMHARWYQPGSGNFTSRDTATLNPHPSVQANRYSYANASPLTNADPAGHSAECSTSCVINMPDRSSGYQQSSNADFIVFSGYFDSRDRSWDRPIKKCSGLACLYSWGPPRDNLVFAGTALKDRTWWEKHYGYFAWAPLLKDDEAKRLGLMSDGRPMEEAVEDECWTWSDEDRTEFRVLYNVFQMYDPSVCCYGDNGFISSAPAKKGKKGVPLPAIWDRDPALKGCHSKQNLSTPKCKKVIQESWADIRWLICGSSVQQPDCTARPDVVGALKALGMPVGLLEFMGSAWSPTMPLEEMDKRLQKWAEGRRATCNRDPATKLMVCKGLDKKYYAGEGPL